MTASPSANAYADMSSRYRCQRRRFNKCIPYAVATESLYVPYLCRRLAASTACPSIDIVAARVGRPLTDDLRVVILERASRMPVRSSIDRLACVALDRFRAVLRVLAGATVVRCESVARRPGFAGMCVEFRWNLFGACQFPWEFGNKIFGDDASPVVLRCVLCP
jgi:hypothetical protein